jgi:predicted nucleic acid-binding protein
MKYLLDTNVCVGFLNQRKPPLTQRFLTVPTLDKVICSLMLRSLRLRLNLDKFGESRL